MEGVEVFHKDGEGSEYRLHKYDYSGTTYYLLNGFVSPQLLFPALANYKPHKGDVWLHTYEKAGTHWTYEIIAILIGGELKPYKQTKIEEFIEMRVESLSHDGPKILNTHMAERYIPNIVFEKAKSIVVVRNPKSVAVSSYYFQRNLHTETHYHGTFNGFWGKFKEIGAFGEYSGTWYDYYVTFWEKYRNNQNVLFIFYEDLKKDPVPIIMKMSQFLGLDRDRAFCEGVARLTTFDYMKADYHQKTIPWKLPIYRKGKIDDWKNEFTVAQNEEFDQDYKERMKMCPDLAALIQFDY